MATESYTVAQGDSLWHIAKKQLGAGHRWPEIYAMNREHIRDPNRIRAGQRFAMPPRNRYGLPEPHPLQRARPHVASLQPTAVPSVPGSPAQPPMPGDPQAMPLPSGIPTPASNPLLATKVNNVAFKFELALLPPVEVPVPQGVVRVSWTGQVYLWRDGVRPLETIGNKGLEIQEKRNAGTVLHGLLESRKLTIGLDRRVTYEDLMSVSAYGAPDTKVSSGFTMTSTSPFPTYRTQIKYTNVVAGRVGEWLFAATDLTINFDVELRPRPPASPPLPQPVAAPARVPAPAAPAAVPGQPRAGDTASDPEAAPSTLRKVEDWAWQHKYEIAATVALGILTLGASAEIEGAALGARALFGVAARAAAGMAARQALPGAGT